MADQGDSSFLAQDARESQLAQKGAYLLANPAEVHLGLTQALLLGFPQHAIELAQEALLNRFGGRPRLVVRTAA